VGGRIQVTSEEARAIAEQFVACLDMRGFAVSYVETRKDDRRPGEWATIFDVYSAQGTLVDGPMVIIVDEKTRAARAFPSL
jgi:hypothetical protein